MDILKALGPSVAVIYFDPCKVARLRRDQLDQLAITSLLAAEGTAAGEWGI